MWLLKNLFHILSFFIIIYFDTRLLHMTLLDSNQFVELSLLRIFLEICQIATF